MILATRSVSVSPRAAQSANRGAHPRGSYILHERARRFTAGTPAGWLSLKCMFSGEALYRSEGGVQVVDADSYLMLNAGQPYEIEIDSRTPVESFCVFFEPGFVEDVFRTETTPTSRLLDNPLDARSGGVSFVPRTFPHDELISPALFAMRHDAHRGLLDASNLDECLRGIARRLLRLRGRVRSEIDAVPAVRGSTRRELYRRLHRGRDYLAATIAAPVSLADAARVACMAPHHFHRTFRAVFGCTPHDFQTRRRLETAARLLQHTDGSVTDICLAVGFESLGTFSTRFRRQFGRSPSQYRRAVLAAT